MDTADTRARLIQAATALYARHGAGATSIRSVVSAANANLNAVHYYFRGKRGLTSAVVQSVMEPINEERLALLGELGPEPGARAVIRAGYWPLVRRALGDVPPQVRLGILAVASLRHDPHEDAIAALAENQSRFSPAFEPAWDAAVGGESTSRRLGVRMINATAWGLATTPALRESLPTEEPGAVERIFERFLDFAEAGLRGMMSSEREGAG